MPCRFRALVDALRAFDIELEEAGSRHNYRFRKSGFRVFPVPAHNGLKTEIPDVYVNGACRNFELDRQEIWRRIRGK